MSSKTAVHKETLQKFIEQELQFDRDMFDHLYRLLSKHFSEFTALGLNDPDKMADLAHKIRSGCQIFGAIALNTELQFIESCAQTKNVTAQKKHYRSAVELIPATVKSIDEISEQIFKQGAQHE